MAKADHIKKLIASFGRNQEFRAAALRIIDDAANQGKRPFAELARKFSTPTSVLITRPYRNLD